MTRRQRVLVVTEDPEFIEQARTTLGPDGLETCACLGPAQADCLLDTKGSCSLADSARAVIVHAPDSGVFRRHEREISATDYTERLARSHPRTFVVLTSPDEDSTVGQAKDALGAVAIVHDALRPRSVTEELSVGIR